MSGASAEAAPSGKGRAILTDIALNVALPYGIYAFLEKAGQSETRALLFSALAPAAVAIAGLIRTRRLNGLSLLVLTATALSLGATALSGSAWFALVQPSFVTGTLGLVFLASLQAKRPMLFYLARDTTCHTAEAAKEFESHWPQKPFQQSMRRLTLVWAAFLCGEALFRLALAAIWPYPALIAATQILWIVLPILLVRWSIVAGRRWAGSAA